MIAAMEYSASTLPPYIEQRAGARTDSAFIRQVFGWMFGGSRKEGNPGAGSGVCAFGPDFGFFGFGGPITSVVALAELSP